MGSLRTGALPQPAGRGDAAFDRRRRSAVPGGPRRPPVEPSGRTDRSGRGRRGPGGGARGRSGDGSGRYRAGVRRAGAAGRRPSEPIRGPLMSDVRSRAHAWETFSQRVGRFSGLDLLGLALLISTVGWTYAAAWASGGNPNRIAELLIATGAALLAARLVAAAASRLVVPAVVVGASAVVWLFSKGG